MYVYTEIIYLYVMRYDYSDMEIWKWKFNSKNDEKKPNHIVMR